MMWTPVLNNIVVIAIFLSLPRLVDGPIDADTSGGSVRLDRVSGDIRAHSSGGGIHIFEAGGRIEADTSGGGIEASFARGNGHGGSLETSGGGIEVSIDPTVGLRVDPAPIVHRRRRAGRRPRRTYRLRRC